MKYIRKLLSAIGIASSFRDSEFSDAMEENVIRDAQSLRESVARMSQIQARAAASNNVLRENLRRSNVKAFADFEHLVHHGGRRSAIRHR